jgi:hypothetical protein
MLPRSELGDSARKTEPVIEQFFVMRGPPEETGPLLTVERQVCPCALSCPWGRRPQGTGLARTALRGVLPVPAADCAALPPALPQMYVLRKLIEQKFRIGGLSDDDAYIVSLSSRTIVYKGQLTPEQVRPAAQPPARLSAARRSMRRVPVRPAVATHAPGGGCRLNSPTVRLRRFLGISRTSRARALPATWR